MGNVLIESNSSIQSENNRKNKCHCLNTYDCSAIILFHSHQQRKSSLDYVRPNLFIWSISFFPKAEINSWTFVSRRLYSDALTVIFYYTREWEFSLSDYSLLICHSPFRTFSLCWFTFYISHWPWNCLTPRFSHLTFTLPCITAVFPTYVYCLVTNLMYFYSLLVIEANFLCCHNRNRFLFIYSIENIASRRLITCTCVKCSALHAFSVRVVWNWIHFTRGCQYICADFSESI